MSRKVFIKSYGCQMNVYDAERMADIMGADAAKGYTPTETADDADLIILNTCHIREKAAEKVYSDIGRLKGLKEKGKAEGRDVLLAVGGCVGQAEGAEIMKRAPVVDMVFGPQTYHRLPEMTDQALTERKTKSNARVLDTDFPVEDKFAALPKARRDAQSAAFLTIQEGCDKFCTFCVVPYTRGAEYSRPVRTVIEDAERLVAAGTVEITLLGQNVNAYHGGFDGEDYTLGKLIRRLAKIEGLERIRYTTSHPRDMHDELIRVHAEVEACMPFLHLPVQSGSDRILGEMNRQHTREHYFGLIDKLRAGRPDLALSSDFIVGFPGETEEDFKATLDLVERVRFAQAYSFKYSPRPGTPAAESADQISEDEKAARLARLHELLNAHQLDFNMAQIGRKLPVLLERPGHQKHQLAGRSPYMQAVHVDMRPDVALDDDSIAKETLDDGAGSAYSSMQGRIMDVEIVSAGPNSLKGRLATSAG